MKRLAVLLIVATVLMGAKCSKTTLTLSEACENSWRIFYRQDGSFTFTDAEIDHLRAVNVDKLIAFKRWFKSECPEQYALTKGGKK